MPIQERRLDRGRRLARQFRATIGREFRDARLSGGLTQRTAARSAGISASEYSRIERGESPRVPYETLAVIAAVLGLDLPLRVFPSGQPVRDAAQLDLLARFRATLPSGVRWRAEVPLPIPGDRRAWDAEIGTPHWRVPIDAESRLHDVQALARREALKCRDAGTDVMILVVANTRHNRRVLRLARLDLAGAFPLGTRPVLAALARGEAPSASGIVLV